MRGMDSGHLAPENDYIYFRDLEPAYHGKVVITTQ
jgi:hypothetical protein